MANWCLYFNSSLIIYNSYMHYIIYSFKYVHIFSSLKSSFNYVELYWGFIVAVKTQKMSIRLSDKTFLLFPSIQAWALISTHTFSACGCFQGAEDHCLISAALDSSGKRRAVDNRLYWLIILKIKRKVQEFWLQLDFKVTETWKCHR